MRPLDGLTIIDLTDGYGYCGMELADHGANVIKVETKKGDSLRSELPIKNGISLSHLMENRGKKSIILDLENEDEQKIFLQLVEKADALIENFSLGYMKSINLSYARLSQINPALVYGRTTFSGTSLAENELAFDELLAQAHTGIMHITGFPENPPTRIGFNIAKHYSSSFLAMGICIAIYHSIKTGEGQLVDTSLCASLVAVTEDKVISYGAEKEDPMRTGNAHPNVNPYDILRCKDGYIALGISSDAQWNKFCVAFDRAEWITHPKYGVNHTRGKHYFSDLRYRLEELFADMSMSEIVSICDEALIPGTMCSTTKEALEETQLYLRDMIKTVKIENDEVLLPGCPVKFIDDKAVEEDKANIVYGEKAGIKSIKAPALDENRQEILELIANEKNNVVSSQSSIQRERKPQKRNVNKKKGPLSGIKVVDFSQVLAAPFCGMMLSDMGAEVIKIERLGTGDISREYGPFINNISLYYCQYNRGKKGIAVDMRSPEGKKLLLEMIRDADIVIENYKAGTMEKMGLGYKTLRELNPKLIYGSISGFGTYGPLSHLPCMDIIAAARSGLVACSGEDNAAPIKPGFSLCDTWSGLQLLRGIAMALIHREKSGKGSRIDLAMLDAAFYLCETPLLEYSKSKVFSKRTGNHHKNYVPYGEFEASDGHVVIAVKTDMDWLKLCEILTVSEEEKHRFKELEFRQKNREQVIALINEKTKKVDRHTLEKTLLKAGLACCAVQTIGEFYKQSKKERIHPFEIIHQDNMGEYLAVNIPVLFSKTPTECNYTAPTYPGAHTVDILTRLGYSKDKIDELVYKGVVEAPFKN